MNPYILEMELKQRRREMIEEAKRRQLIVLYNAQQRQQSPTSLLLAVAELLITIGLTLKRRHQQTPALSTGPGGE